MKKGFLSTLILFILLVTSACSTIFTNKSTSIKKETESSKSQQVKPVSINQLKDLDITTFFSKSAGFSDFSPFMIHRSQIKQIITNIRVGV